MTAEPRYYSNNPLSDNNFMAYLDWAFSVGGAVTDTWIDEATKSATGIISKTINLVGKTGAISNAVSLSVECIIDANTRQATLNVGGVQKLMIDMTITGVATTVATGLMAIASSSFWVTVGIAVGIDMIYNAVLGDTVAEIIDFMNNTVDVDIQLIDANGNLLSGALYPDGLGVGIEGRDAAKDVLDKNEAILGQISTIDIYIGTNERTLDERFIIFQKEFIDAILNFTGDDLIEFVTRSGVDANEQYLSNRDIYYSLDDSFSFTPQETDLIIAKDTDRLFVEIDGEVYGFNPSHIGFDGGFGVPTEGDNLIVGTENDDIIAGASGNDFLYGGNGMDTIFGGSDNDTIYGGEGDDEIHGGLGDDTLYGGLGEDTYYLHRGQ